jgi:aspartyl-tRNA(Asn)/glutamyl-tRNA(Gln) amidotransferase subunit C
MSRLSLDDAYRVAKLAALELSEQDAHAMREQLEKILEHIAALDAVDASGVEPTFHPFASEAPLRADIARLSGLREELLASAPRVEGPGFAVPKVLDGD